jgi:hypothetical protein
MELVSIIRIRIRMSKEIGAMAADAALICVPQNKRCDKDLAA